MSRIVRVDDEVAAELRRISARSMSEAVRALLKRTEHVEYVKSHGGDECGCSFCVGWVANDQILGGKKK